MSSASSSKSRIRPSGKLDVASFGGCKLARSYQAPDFQIRISQLQCGDNSLLLEGKVDGKACEMVIDTGASHTIVRADLIPEGRVKIPEKVYVITTADGNAMEVLGIVHTDIVLGHRIFRERMFVAPIKDPVILGMDFLKGHNVTLDLGGRRIVLDGDEFVLKCKSQGYGVIRKALVSEDLTLPAKSEICTTIELEGESDDFVGILEPEISNQHGILLGRTLISTRTSKVPVRLLNVNNSEVSLRKGTIIGQCEPVTMIANTDSQKEHLVGDYQQEPTMMDNFITTTVQSLPSDKRSSAVSLLRKYRKVFALHDNELGRTNLVQHRINTGNHQPIKQAPRRVPLAKQQEVCQMLREMEDQKFIEPSNSPWASPIVLVKKKDGSTRFCVDYRKLNEVTKKDSYPLPRMDDTLDTLANAKWFSTLDLKSGYWQVEMHPDDREKTAFSNGNGLWQFNVMPFGLCNAPATFERLMESVLKGLHWKTCLVYLDDVIIFSSTFDEHLRNLEEILQKLSNAGLKLSPKKCQLFRKEVKYLGHIISSKGVMTDPQKTEAVRDWPVPKDKHDIRSFLGLCSYYRRFVHKFAEIARPLHRLTENEQGFEWTSKCQEAFDQLKEALCSAPIMAYPRAGQEFIVDTDASSYGIGGILSQIQNGQEVVIAYFSKALSKAEKNYCVTRKELLAIVKTLEHFHKYLYGQPFLLRTDHASLTWILDFKNPEGQVARWIERLQEYQFKIEHRRGQMHGNADALSRRPCKADCKHCCRAEQKESLQCQRTVVHPPDNWSPSSLRLDQLQDKEIGRILRYKEENSRPQWKDISMLSPAFKSYWAQWNSLVVLDGVLRRQWESTDGKEIKYQTVLPSNRRKEVLKEIHDGMSGCHFGIRKTLEKLRERFYWVGYTDDVTEWCRKCPECNASKGPITRCRGAMKQYNVGAPFERIALDVAGPFPRTKKGNRLILVVGDYFSKWTEAYAVPNQEASTIAEIFIEQWISRFGVPMELHSDQGRNFESSIFSKTCEILGIRKTRTTPLHPQSDGMVERFNKTLENQLRIFVSDHQDDWDEHLPIITMAYRSAVHESTGRTPSSVVFGRELRLPSDLLFGSPYRKNEEVNDYAENLRQRLTNVHEQVRIKMKIESDRMKARYDIRASGKTFEEGDEVWLYNPTRKKGLSPKLQQSWEGPYKVIKRINDVVYRIQRSPKTKMKVVHLDRLRPYVSREAVRDEQP